MKLAELTKLGRINNRAGVTHVLWRTPLTDILISNHVPLCFEDDKGLGIATVYEGAGKVTCSACLQIVHIIDDNPGPDDPPFQILSWIWDRLQAKDVITVNTYCDKFGKEWAMDFAAVCRALCAMGFLTIHTRGHISINRQQNLARMRWNSPTDPNAPPKKHLKDLDSLLGKSIDMIDFIGDGRVGIVVDTGEYLVLEGMSDYDDGHDIGIKQELDMYTLQSIGVITADDVARMREVQEDQETADEETAERALLAELKDKYEA